VTSISQNAIPDSNVSGASSFLSSTNSCARSSGSFAQICAAQLAVPSPRTTVAPVESTAENASQVLIAKTSNALRSKNSKSALAVLPTIDLQPLMPREPSSTNDRSPAPPSSEPVSENASVPAVDGPSNGNSASSPLPTALSVSQTMAAQTTALSDPLASISASPSTNSFSPSKAEKSNTDPTAETVSDPAPSKTGSLYPASTPAQAPWTLDPARDVDSAASSPEDLSTQLAGVSQPASSPPSQPAQVQVSASVPITTTPSESAIPTGSAAASTPSVITGTVQAASAAAVGHLSTEPPGNTTQPDPASPLTSAVISQAVDGKQSGRRSSPGTPEPVKSKPVGSAAVVESPATIRTGTPTGFSQESPQRLTPSPDATAHLIPGVETTAVDSRSFLTVTVTDTDSNKNVAANPVVPNNSVASASPTQTGPNRSVPPSAGDNSSSDQSQHRDPVDPPTQILAAVPPPATSSAAAVVLPGPATQGAEVPASGPSAPRTNANAPVGLPDPASNPSLTVPPTASAGASPVQLAQMAAKATQSEMRIGLNTTAFGTVEIRTTVRANDVGVLIGSERGDLRSMLANELPAIANTLQQQQNLRLTQVSFHQQGFAFSSGSSSGGDSNPRSFPTKPNPASSLSSESSSASSSSSTEPLNSDSSNSGFSILA
jgi:flagellar hook-length control protein FliK